MQLLGDGELSITGRDKLRKFLLVQNDTIYFARIQKKKMTLAKFYKLY